MSSWCSLMDKAPPFPGQHLALFISHKCFAKFIPHRAACFGFSAWLGFPTPARFFQGGGSCPAKLFCGSASLTPWLQGQPTGPNCPEQRKTPALFRGGGTSHYGWQLLPHPPPPAGRGNRRGTWRNSANRRKGGTHFPSLHRRRCTQLGFYTLDPVLLQAFTGSREDLGEEGKKVEMLTTDSKAGPVPLGQS